MLLRASALPALGLYIAELYGGATLRHGGSLNSQYTEEEKHQFDLLGSDGMSVAEQRTDPFAGVICTSQKSPCCGSKVTSCVEEHQGIGTVTLGRLYRTFRNNEAGFPVFPGIPAGCSAAGFWHFILR